MDSNVAATPFFSYRNHDTLRLLDRHRAIADRVVFVFFDAWTIACRTHFDLLERMGAYGFTPIAYAAHRLTEGEIEQMYRRNLPIRADNSWHVAKEVYLTGPSLGVLLHRAADDEPATLAMQRIKGKSNPALGRPGQLRYEGRAPNRSLSLMHSSDDWAATLYESILFFDPVQLDALFRSVADGTFGPVDEQDWPLVEGCLAITNPSPVHLLLRLRLRAAAVVRRMQGPDEPLRRLTALWRAEAEAVDPRAPVPESVRRYLQMIAREQADVAELTGRPSSAVRTAPRLYHRGEPCLADALLMLSVLAEPESYMLVDGPALSRKESLFMDRWEKLLFTTTLFNFDDFLEPRP